LIHMVFALTRSNCCPSLIMMCRREITLNMWGFG
jgi:hypothetical protein